MNLGNSKINIYVYTVYEKPKIFFGSAFLLPVMKTQQHVVASVVKNTVNVLNYIIDKSTCSRQKK